MVKINASHISGIALPNALPDDPAYWEKSESETTTYRSNMISETLTEFHGTSNQYK